MGSRRAGHCGMGPSAQTAGPRGRTSGTSDVLGAMCNKGEGAAFCLKYYLLSGQNLIFCSANILKLSALTYFKNIPVFLFSSFTFTCTEMVKFQNNFIINLHFLVSTSCFCFFNENLSAINKMYLILISMEKGIFNLKPTFYLKKRKEDYPVGKILTAKMRKTPNLMTDSDVQNDVGLVFPFYPLCEDHWVSLRAKCVRQSCHLPSHRSPVCVPQNQAPCSPCWAG